MRLKPTPREVIPRLTIVLILLVLPIAGIMFFNPSWELAEYLLLSAIYTAAYVGLVLYRWAKGKLDWFEPGVFIGGLYLVMFVYGGLYLFLNPDLLHPFLREGLGWLSLALFYVVLGVALFWVGYYNKLGETLHRLTNRARRASERAHAHIRPEVVVGLYLIGLATRLYLLREGLYGYLKNIDYYFTTLAYAQVFSQLELLCQYALVLALLDYFSHPRHPGRWLLAYSLLVSELVWGFFSGFKYLLVLPIFFYIMIYTYKRRQFPLRYVAIAAALLVLVFPINSTYRWMVYTGTLQINSPMDMVAAVPDVSAELLSHYDSLNLYVGTGYDSLLNRVSLLQYFAVLLNYLNHTQLFARGQQLWMLPALILVPRALWSSKPLAESGYWFAVNVWGQDPHLRSAVAITYVGDLYLQFGLPSLLLGMFLTGVLLRWIYERYAQPRSDFSLFFYVLLFPQFVNPEPDVTYLLGGAVRLFLILLAVSFVAFRYPSRRSRPRVVPVDEGLVAAPGAPRALQV